MLSNDSQKNSYIFVNVIEAISMISFVLIFILSTIRLLLPQKTWIDNYIIAEPWDFLGGSFIAHLCFVWQQSQNYTLPNIGKGILNAQ